MKRHYILGCLTGWALWFVLVVVERVYSASVGSVPHWIRVVSDPVMTGVGLAVWPLALGGWFVWGEGRHMGLLINVAIGFLLYGTLGVVAAAFIRHRSR